ncbi:peptidoglycan recognition protein family protein [Carbonactinospora thermoautotrophica]|uniref:peptidoglycan recognition protein family protein n=1 Tax=Carbonactinospora thermoautotrophica TaxID=1469144 RepID=UPI00226E416B|nr:peptidoglycan recognition protein [Carbonactinospora thermoautotrophica]
MAKEAERGGAGWGPVKVYTVPLAAVGQPDRERSTVLGVAERRTQPFSLLGVTWSEPEADVGGVVRVRTRSSVTGQWSGWRELDSDNHRGADPGERERTRGSTSPLWVGPSDGVEVRVVPAGGRPPGRLPAGLRLDLVDPGNGGFAVERVAHTVAEHSRGSTGDTQPVTDPGGTILADPIQPAEPTSASVLAALLPDVSAPPIVSRAEWGADETLNEEPPAYGSSIKAVFVHHTATGNDYSCADSAAIVRGIHAYHVQSNGWKDIGYNFLVDKCGTVFEGRKGGVDMPVIGAHAYGFNTDTTGVAVIGTYSTVGISSAALRAVARIAAWKLDTGDPRGKVTLTSAADGNKFTAGQQVRLYRIAGHRDVALTECPGQRLYDQLPAIRRYAARLAT